jgi:cyclophilin family peptidyl-prolyl cis-trans isomerase
MSATAPRRLVALAALSLAALIGCGGDDGSTTAALPSGCQEVSQPPPKPVKLKAPKQRVHAGGERLTATVETSCGSFDIVLDTGASPKTVNSFAYLAQKGFYSGTTFYRVVPNFLIQAGDRSGDGTGGPGYTVDEPPPPTTEYTRGTVGMARTPIEPPGRSGSQFFVITAVDSGLPPNYAVLGHVSSGQATIDRIASLGDPASGDAGTPRGTVVIRRVTIQGG